MNQSLRVLSIVVAALFAVRARFRLAHSTRGEFVPAKLIKEGKTSTTIAGSGQVVVQVQVNAEWIAQGHENHQLDELGRQRRRGDRDREQLDLSGRLAVEPRRSPRFTISP